VKRIPRGDEHWTRLHPERWRGCVLTADDARAIKRRYKAGERPYAIAKDYTAVHPDTIARIARGVTWKHVKADDEREAAE
jgi:hypothetical protein